VTAPVCAIAGVGPGLGLALARRFGKGGFAIALIGRRETALTGFVDTLSSEGVDAAGFAADLAEEQSIKAAFDRIKSWKGPVEALIYNAADMASDDVTTLTAERLQHAMAVTLGGAVTCVGEVLPGMLERKKGTIIATSGGLALDPYPQWAALGAGKAALHNYIGALHKAVSPSGINAAVVAVCGIVEPGGLFDPDLIAEEYYKLHRADPSDWRPELIYRPEAADADYNATTS